MIMLVLLLERHGVKIRMQLAKLFENKPKQAALGNSKKWSHKKCLKTLSVGNNSNAIYCRAIALKQMFLLLDETSSALDPSFLQVKLERALLQLTRKTMSIIIFDTICSKHLD